MRPAGAVKASAARIIRVSLREKPFSESLALNCGQESEWMSGSSRGESGTTVSRLEVFKRHGQRQGPWVRNTTGLHLF